jgi:hypothetical protein
MSSPAMWSRQPQRELLCADSEQAGLLARAQEIENLEKELRAQVMIADEARVALVRAEAPMPMLRSVWWVCGAKPP